MAAQFSEFRLAMDDGCLVDNYNKFNYYDYFTDFSCNRVNSDSWRDLKIFTQLSYKQINMSNQ